MMGLKYIAIGRNVYGRADTAVEALKNALTRGGGNRYRLYLVSSDTVVGGIDGALEYPPEGAAPVLIGIFNDKKTLLIDKTEG